MLANRNIIVENFLTPVMTAALCLKHCESDSNNNPMPVLPYDVQRIILSRMVENIKEDVEKSSGIPIEDCKTLVIEFDEFIHHESKKSEIVFEAEPIKSGMRTLEPHFALRVKRSNARDYLKVVAYPYFNKFRRFQSRKHFDFVLSRKNAIQERRDYLAEVSKGIADEGLIAERVQKKAREHLTHLAILEYFFDHAVVDVHVNVRDATIYNMRAIVGNRDIEEITNNPISRELKGFFDNIPKEMMNYRVPAQISFPLTPSVRDVPIDTMTVKIRKSSIEEHFRNQRWSM